MKRLTFAVAALMGLIVVGAVHGQDTTTLLTYFLTDLRSGSIGTILSTGFSAKAGTIAAPSFTFAGDTASGLALVSTNPSFSRSNTNVFSMTSSGISILNTKAIGWSTDPANSGMSTTLSLPAAGAILLTGTSVALQLRATQTAVPTVTAGGGTGPVCVGTDTFMGCTIGTAPAVQTTFTVTFNGTWAAAPSCIAVRGTTGTTPAVTAAVTSATTVVVNLSANVVASERYNILCAGVQ